MSRPHQHLVYIGLGVLICSAGLLASAWLQPPKRVRRPTTTTVVGTGTSSSSNIVFTFELNDFEPQFFLGNCHLQTIIGSEALQSKILNRSSFPRTYDVVTERVKTPDADFFDVEYTPNFGAAESVVLILHGLESNSKGPLVTKMATSFLANGFGCCLVSFRSCSGEENLTPGAYHLGFTKDVDQLTQAIHSAHPQKSIYLAGFSLGGNVILKLLGELGERAAERNIRGACVCSVPFDPVASQGKLDVGLNRLLYSENFLSTLKVKAKRQEQRFPGLVDIQAIMNCRTIGEFDELYIAKIYKFKDKVDYYRKTGSKWWLHKITVPTIAINARDDPFIEEASLPTQEDIQTAPVKLLYTEQGGHCGFSRTTNKDSPSYGWLANEMGRALEHLRSSHKEQ